MNRKQSRAAAKRLRRQDRNLRTWNGDRSPTTTANDRLMTVRHAWLENRTEATRRAYEAACVNAGVTVEDVEHFFRV